MIFKFLFLSPPFGIYTRWIEIPLNPTTETQELFNRMSVNDRDQYDRGVVGGS